MGFVVLHMEKAHGSDSGTTAHRAFHHTQERRPHTHASKPAHRISRRSERPFGYPKGLEEAGLTRKIGSNQVRAIRINVSNTREPMERIRTGGTAGRVVRRQPHCFADTFGRENIVAAHLHLDEKNAAHARHTCADSQGNASGRKGRSRRRNATAEADRHRAAQMTS